MMAEQRQEAVERQVGFQTVRLLKSETLGIGSYGSVCKARCDNLVCAAKILHPTLFDPTAHQKIARKREHRLPIKRFEQECEFMSAIRHPNIVQYLGMHQDPETGLPVLLMELMDDSLTHFLESSQNTVPYHIQVNFCHDITLALSFLHSNGITHRDLSSNNVLLCGNVKAKVTDFGMAKLSDTTPERTRSFTMCPGTDSFMPPEAAKNVPEYTEKIDCFSFGVLVIQILTKKFPDPSDRLKEICTVDPQFPSGTVEVRVAEVERRQAHIKDIDANDPLLLIALDCLRDRETQRPSSQDLCDRITALKETAKYVESVRSVAERVDRLREELEQQHVSEINDLKDEHAEQLEQKDKTISTQQEDIEQLTIENQQLKEQLQEKDKEIACIQREHLQALQIKTQAVNAQKRKKQEFFELVKQYKEQKEHHAMEISELHTEKDQQISERDKTNVARQEENQHLREEIQKLRQEHDRQIKERDETIAARQQEICLLNQRHFKQLQHYKSMLSKHWILTLLSQYPIDDVPDYKAQKTELHPLLQQRLRKGDTWYLVDVRWMKQWKKYVGYDQWDQSSAGQESANPGPVDNSTLFKDRETESMREHLMEELDYYLLPEGAWNKVVSWYGITKDTRPIARRVVEHGLYMKHCKVEVYLLEFKLCLHPHLDVTVRKEFSRDDTVGDLETALKAEFGIPKEAECRVWHRYMAHTYELLSTPSQTLQDAGLYNGQTIVLEKKNEDGSWPRQSQKSSSSQHPTRSTDDTS